MQVNKINKSISETQNNGNDYNRACLFYQLTQQNIQGKDNILINTEDYLRPNARTNERMGGGKANENNYLHRQQQ